MTPAILMSLLNTYLTFLIATNYMEIKWSLIPAAIAFVITYILMSLELYVVAIIIRIALVLLGALVTTKK